MRDDGRTVRWIAGFTSVAMGGQQEPVRGTVELMYQVRDPFAVTAAFRTGRNKRVIWTFARELLGEGMRSPSGVGDVRVEPWRDAGRVLITLRSPAGRTLVTVPRKDVSGFLGLTYDLVPEGEESARADIDGELVKLLA
jgi:hypothetical protein